MIPESNMDHPRELVYAVDELDEDTPNDIPAPPPQGFHVALRVRHVSGGRRQSAWGQRARDPWWLGYR